MDKLKANLTNYNTIYARYYSTLIDEQFTQVAVGNDSDYLSIKVLTNTNINNTKKKSQEVDDAALFMDNNLKILATFPYTKSLNNMHKIDDMSAISSRYAITEYFNIIYYDNLLTPGSKCKYAINDTNNGIKHLNFLTQTFENIAQHKGPFPIGIIASKLENLHKELI